MSECPSGCGRKVRAGQLLCGACWAEVPKHLQRDVLRTWRAYSRAHKKSVAEMRDPDASAEERAAAIHSSALARQEYQDARDAALGSIR